MADAIDVEQLADELRVGIGLLLRRLKQTQVEGELSLPESLALARLDRGGPATGSALAKLEQISPQSMGATLAALEARRLVRRDPDPADRRRVLISVTEAGSRALGDRRNVRTQLLVRALAEGFTPAELARLAAAAPLIERLAERL